MPTIPTARIPPGSPLGQGLIGQCAIDTRRRLITDIPDTVVPIGSALFRVPPRNVMVLPVLFENQVKAVIELASITPFTTLQITFLEQLTASIGIVLNSIEATMQTEDLLKQSQKLAAELQSQQGELQQTNEQLEQKAQQLAERNVEVERKNQEIEQARRAVEEKATELALTSKYKSEFLANMSHELRTPLNSILILGQQLSENPDGNLTPKQVEFSRTIHGAGTDLLNLISDILDLSKIESGTVTVEAEEIVLKNLVEAVARPFRHEADNRQLTFAVDLDPQLHSIVTDAKRLQQVLKNLLSNAFKFTERGGVALRVAHTSGGWNPDHPILRQAPSVIALEVSDTGIGIPFEKQKIIFEAFQQADASTSRRYGGTGLGLAISRELANLLGGEIHLRSTPGGGSVFTLYLPMKYLGPSALLRSATPPLPLPAEAAFLGTPMAVQVTEAIADDRLALQPGDLSLLIVEDDPHYARVLLDLAHAARLQGAPRPPRRRRGRACPRVPAQGDYARRLPSRHARLDGAFAAEAEPGHPAHSGADHYPRRRPSARAGAWRLRLLPIKPTTLDGVGRALERIKAFTGPRRKRLLVVEDNPAEQMSIVELLAHDDIEIETVGTGRDALARLGAEEDPCDCVVLDLRLPDMSGFEVLESMAEAPGLADVPVVVFTGRELSAEEDAELHTMARSIVVKGVESPERLLDETALFLHRVVTDLPADKQRMLERLNSSDEDLVGRTVLLVDDDARNIFALSSLLERRGMKVLTATTGAEAIDLIEATPDLALVLMDIMMPEMDGYQTIGHIRTRPGLPPSPDHRADRQGDEGRPREVPRSGRVRLPGEAGQYRTAVDGAQNVAASLELGGAIRCTTTKSTSSSSTTSRRNSSATR